MEINIRARVFNIWISKYVTWYSHWDVCLRVTSQNHHSYLCPPVTNGSLLKLWWDGDVPIQFGSFRHFDNTLCSQTQLHNNNRKGSQWKMQTNKFLTIDWRFFSHFVKSRHESGTDTEVVFVFWSSSDFFGTKKNKISPLLLFSSSYWAAGLSSLGEPSRD